MRLAAVRAEDDAERSLGAGGQLALRRLAVDQEPARRRQQIGRAGAVGLFFLADDEEQIHARFASRKEALAGDEHGGRNPLRIARTAPDQPVAVKAWTDVRGNGVEVRR